jgi:thiol-disulfide isomerase/thioredoxin
MAGGGPWITFKLVTVNKRLLFGSLAVATALIVVVGIVQASDSDNNTEDVTLTSGNDLSPTIGTNAAVTGKALPLVDIQTLAGDKFATADLIGKPLVVNFWYSTCAPCKKELPGFAAVHAKLGDQVRFVGVDSLPPSDTEENFARDKGVQYELLYDPDGELTSTVGVAAYPQTLFIDSGGTILEQTGELTADKLEELIRTTLL